MMSDALTPNVVDIPIGNVGQQRPDHSGPEGRLLSLVNGEIVQYVPPSIQSPPKNTVRQRPAFTGMPAAIRSLDTGLVVSDDFHDPQLLHAIEDELVSISHSTARVFNGNDAWTQHDQIVATQELSEEVIHTTNKVVQAPDSAWVGGIECVVWNEADLVADTATSYVGFRAENGSWLVKPKAMFTSDPAARTIIRVIADVTNEIFWVFCPDPVNPNIKGHVFDLRGVELASDGVLREWLQTPGFWDIASTRMTISSVQYTAALCQPHANTGTDTNVGTEVTYFHWNGATISHTTVTYGTGVTSCSGAVAWLTNKTTIPANVLYLATVGAGGSGSDKIHAYEITDGTLTHTYDTVQTFAKAEVDALFGYAEPASGGVHVGLAVSLLAPGPASVGPVYDPALRAVVVYEVSRANAESFKVQHNGVLAQSRAFDIDDHWHAVTYYQSGQGSSRVPSTSAVSWTSGDYMTGGATQNLTVSAGDYLNGAGHLIPSDHTAIVPSQSLASFARLAGDGVVAATQHWTLQNAAFQSDPYGLSATNSYLNVTGATPSSLNTSWRILSVIDATHVITAPIGDNGTPLADSNLSGASFTVTGTTAINVPVGSGSPPNGHVIPSDVARLFVGGTVVVAGAYNLSNNGTYTIRAIDQDAALEGYPSPSPNADVTAIICATTPGSRETFPGTLTLHPLPPEDLWHLAASPFNTQDIGWIIALTEGGQRGSAIVTSISGTNAVTGGLALLPKSFDPAIDSIQLLSSTPAQLYQFFLQSVTFDQAWIGGLISVSNAANPANNGVYKITAVLGTHAVTATPATGATGQRNETFANTIAVTAQKPALPGPANQPTWFVSPLNVNQQTVGRFENGLAYADWRFDGDATHPNYFLLGLSTAFRRPETGQIKVTLPYRSQSFTADQTVKISGVNLTVPDVLKSTVGLKDFTIAPVSGSAHNFIDTMLLPGLQAQQFGTSGFSDQGISLFFETPFLFSQSTDSSVIGITPGSRRQYVVVAEVTDENGERVFSVPSQPFDVTMTGTNNKVTLRGRMIGPTNRIVGIAIYATAWNGGAAAQQTTAHFKITNDLDINGVGFSFSTQGYTYGGLKDTWTYVDTAADGDIQSHEELYTDKGQLPHFPAPANSGYATWEGRVVVRGYDGALWLSGDKTEGDALWFHPGLRIVLPSETKPVNAIPVDTYLMVFGKESFFYLPSTVLPDNTGQGGSLPQPDPVQFQGGCGGPAAASKNGALYFNPQSGGVWQITRGVTNAWFSEDIRTELTGASNVTGLAVDGQQRVYATVADLVGDRMFVFDQVSATWWRWDLPSAPLLLAIWQGRPVYQDTTYVMASDPTATADTRAANRFGIPIRVDFSSLNFGRIRSFKRLWALQLTGKIKGPCTVHAQISYPDELGLTPTAFAFDAQASPPPFEINPEEETASTYGLSVWTSFEGVDIPGNSIELEAISAEVGIIPGINRAPDAQRKAASG